MSDRFGLKVKENAGKTKYSSLNLNQTYKGTKVETKTSSGTARHGLQSLGKVGASRRIPPPANLPSLKSENSGNDPTVSLVPSGGGGWGSTKEKASENPPTTSQPPTPSSTPSQANVPTVQQPLLQPQRPIPPPSHPQQPQPQSQNSGQTQTQPVKQAESQAKTWGTVSSNGAGGPGKTSSHQEMPYFNREFPVLGGGGSGERMPQHMEEKNHHQYGPRPVMRNTHEPAWMERSGPGPPPPDYGPGRERPEVYNGGPGPGYSGGQQYRRPPDYQHSHGKSHPQGHTAHHHGSGPHGYGPAPGPGRHPHGHPPDYYSRGPVHKPGGGPAPVHPSKPYEGRGEGYGRPAILKPEDIQAMADNDEEEEGGWAGAQDEVDYAAKLDFEDFDDDEKPPVEPAREKSDRGVTTNEQDSRWQSSEGRPVKEMGPSPTRPAWSETPGALHPYQDSRQVPPSPGMRPFDSRGSPPAPGWPMPYPQHVAAQQRGGGIPAHPSPDQGKPAPNEGEPVVSEWQKRRVKQQEEMRAAVERARRRREEDELKRQAEQKAAASAKLKELEMKRARRESGKEGDDAWAEELDSIEKDVHSKEPTSDHHIPESPHGEHEPQQTAITQPDSVTLRNEVPEYINRQRNDSESSDASRSSASRGTSRAHHHPPRDIPPRFQQQQLRQQQQQHFPPHYQQQQAHPQQYLYHHQQLPRSPQHREFQEGPLTVSSHPVVDTGPVSPSQSVKPDQPVRRIMKRSDSSSTAGDDTASVKSLESGSGEATRESEKRPSSSSSKTDKVNVTSEQTKESSFEGNKSDVIRAEKPVDDQDLPVFDEVGSVETGEPRQRKQPESEKPERCESDKENDVVKDRVSDKTQRKDSLDGPTKPVLEKTPPNRDRREERRGSKRDMRHDERRYEDPKDLGKRKRDNTDEGGRFPERRGRFAGRGDSKRERFSEPHGRGRVTFPIRGHSRGMGSGSASFRGRGRGERGIRDSRDSRDYREPKPSRSREPKASAPTKNVDSEQKQREEDNEIVPVKENCIKSVDDSAEKVQENVVAVKQEKELESSSLLPEKDEIMQRKDEEIANKEKKVVPSQTENRDGESEDSSPKFSNRDTENSRRQDDSRKKSDSNREAGNLKPKGRGGFGKPPQYSDDSRRPGFDDKRPGSKKFTDGRRAFQDGGRGRSEDYEEKRFSRNYRDQTNQRSSARENRNWGRGREKEQKSQSQHERDTGNRQFSQDDRKKRISEKDDNQQYSKQRPSDRNQRGGYRGGYSTRGQFSKPVRGSMRGGRSNQPVGSGRVGSNNRRSKSTDEELSDDDYDSDSSSYTTATSASEERRDERTSDKDNDVKKGKESSANYDKSRASSRSTRSPLRGKVSSRAGGRGAGGFGRSRREVERPPRFQKQQERERAGLGRGVSRGDRHNEGRESGPGRGRGRGRGRREQFPKDSSEGSGIPVTEDWDEELGDSIKEEESSRGDKTAFRKESAQRRGFPASRTASERTRKDRSRESGGTRNTSSRKEHFLAEKQQAKVEGSKSAGGEPRVPLPAARNGFSKDGSRRPDVQNNSHGTGLDSINTGIVETKVLKKQEAPLRKTDIQQFDLHNIAGVICIDDMTDDDSDISSTHSGFVEVTYRRTQKENKDRQREEEERRRKGDEQTRQRSNQASNKKNQSSKPPRFSKQHVPQANTQSKTPGVVGKVISAAVSEAVGGLANTVSNSNPSSASSTKRNSPVTVERPISPAPPPVFNAWDKPLIVTPAKPPSAPLITTSVPDPLAVGSGKPSSTRPAQSGTVMPSAPPSLIEDASVDEDYIAMTKEIALLAPPEEPEESEEPTQPVTTTKPKIETTELTSEKGTKLTDTSEKRSQPKPQREKPPRFDRTGKRRVGAAGNETKKEQSGGAKGRKSSRENSGSQKHQAKASGDKNLTGKTATSNNQQQSSSAEEQTGDGLDLSKEVQEVEEFDVAAVATVSDEGSEDKDDLKESEEQEAKDDSESESSRKDSEPDLNEDSNERNSDADNLFSTGALAVDIHERSTADRQVREPSPVSPAIVEMTMKMEASRKLWESGLDIRRTGNPVTAWKETLRTPASVSSSIVGMPVVESTDLRLNDDQVSVSKSQGELEVNTSKSDSKPSDGISFSKKTGSGEQQNVCKVKPQQQQQAPVKPQQSSSLVSQTSEENHPNELNTVPLSQPLLPQDQLLAQQAIPQRFAYPLINQYMDLQQRQSFLRQQQLQQLQETNQQVTPTFPLNHVQQVNQARSTSSPLSQATQDIYQSSFLASGVYPAGNFQGSQPYVSIALLSSSTTQSYATSTSRTQTTSLMGIQPPQPKPASGSVFPQNVNPQTGQTMYMPFDPKSLSGGAPLFNLAQHPQAAQRHLLGAQSGIVSDSVPRQGSFPTAQPTHQSFPAGYPFQQKQGTYDVSQDVQMKQKAAEQNDYSRQSELVKHVNAKPFEPPKRSTPGSVSAAAGGTVIGPLVSSTFARNPNLMTIRPSPVELGGTSQSPPVSTSIISGRPVSMSPVDPGVPFPGAVGTFPKHAAISQFQVQQQPQGVQPQQFTPFQQQPVGIQHTLQIRPQAQQQQQAVNPLPGATATIVPNPAVMAATMPRQLIRAPGLGALGVGGAQPSAPNTQRFPAPIQRPMTTSLMHGVTHMQAPRGPRPQPAPPQMVPTKQVVSNRPQMPQPSAPHQDPVVAAFKLEQHHKMMEQTRMFFAQQGQLQQQQRVPPNIQVEQPKAVSSSQGDQPTVKGQIPRENHKPQDKKEELNQRNRKTNSEQPNKTSKTTKLDSKPDESSKDKNTKQDGKGATNKSGSSSSSIVRIQPLHMPARNKPNRPRGPPRMPGMPPSKAKLSGRPEKEVKDTSASDKPRESPSPKNSDQAKASEAQSVPPLGVNKG